MTSGSQLLYWLLWIILVIVNHCGISTFSTWSPVEMAQPLPSLGMVVLFHVIPRHGMCHTCAIPYYIAPCRARPCRATCAKPTRPEPSRAVPCRAVPCRARLDRAVEPCPIAPCFYCCLPCMQCTFVARQFLSSPLDLDPAQFGAIATCLRSYLH